MYVYRHCLVRCSGLCKRMVLYFVSAVARPVSLWLKAVPKPERKHGHRHHDHMLSTETALEELEGAKTSLQQLFHNIMYYVIVVSHFCERVLLNKYYQSCRIVPFVLAAVVLIIEVRYSSSNISIPRA
jgi:hypothetical protein